MSCNHLFGYVISAISSVGVYLVPESRNRGVGTGRLRQERPVVEP